MNFHKRFGAGQKTRNHIWMNLAFCGSPLSYNKRITIGTIIMNHNSSCLKLVFSLPTPD